MEPKDLKNSNAELSGAPVEPETVNDQIVTEETVDQSKVIELAEVEETVEEALEETLPLSVETTEQELIEEIIPEVSEGVTPAVEDEIVEEKTEVESEIPSIEELIDISEEDLELHDEEILDESSPIVKAADYANLSEIELINELRNLLQNDDFESIKDDVDAIKINFFRRYRANIEAQKTAFAEAGGNLEEFKAEADPYEADLRNLLKQYQDIRNEHNKKIDETKEANLLKKYEIIEEIKALINNKESINKTFHDFRDLQNRWREIGLVPQAKLKDLWDTYHHHVENFYDFIKINKELRDLNLRKNLEIKIEICEKSEELLV